MKKRFLLVFIFCFAAMVSYAQGFYFDIGLGTGIGWTVVDNKDMVKELRKFGARPSELGIDLGLKAGFGPFGRVPLYVAGELGGIGHRIYDSSSYIQFNSYIFGGGLIFYPISLIQLGASMGYSWVNNDTDEPGIKMLGSEGGYAWNVSAAVDLGSRNHGCLLGIKYFHAVNTLKVSNVEEKASMLSVFVKYAYRKKVSP